MRTPSGECDAPAGREKWATHPSDARRLPVERIPAATQRESGFRWISVTRASRQPSGSARSCARNRCSLTDVVTECKLPALRLAVPWSEEEPQDQAQHRQEHHRDCPNQFLLV